MTLPPTALVMVGSVAAAAISGFVAYVALVRTKEQTIADFRAEWIKALTADLAKLFSEIDLLLKLVEVEMHNPKEGLDKSRLRAFRNRHREYYQQLNESFNLVKLRLDGTKHRHILDDLNKLYREFYGRCDNVAEIYRLQNQLTENARALSEEIWGRIRQGDDSYRRVSRNIVYFVAGSAIAALAFAAYFLRDHIRFDALPTL